MSYSITTTPEFSKEIKRLAKKYPSLKSEYIQLLHSLLTEPFQGTTLGNNIFKIRLSVKSKSTGKRGGARVITFVRVLENEILLISIYDKAGQGNMTSKEINERIKKNLF